MSEAEKSGGKELTKAEELSTTQLTALDLLVSGKSIAEAAREVGVSRTTIYKWKKQDPNFSAAYNQWREEAHESSQARLSTILDKAAAALEKGFEAGDARTALNFLKGMGVVRPLGKEDMETDPEHLRHEMEIRDRRKKIARKRDVEHATLEEMMPEL